MNDLSESDKTIKVWDIYSGIELLILRGHEGEISSVAFSKDGVRIVSSTYDTTVRMWDAVIGEELTTFFRRGRMVSSAAFSLDGKTKNRIVTSLYCEFLGTYSH
ncbi:MAG: hypothetical protein P8016_06205 [Sedimentisphaerales bacterium]